jgi:hypothetical protein
LNAVFISHESPDMMAGIMAAASDQIDILGIPPFNI